MDRILKVGVIGTGNIGTNTHIPALATLPEAALAAVYDIDPAAARRGRDIYLKLRREAGFEVSEGDVTVCESAEQLMSLVDVADICSSLRWHAYYADLALSRGVPAMSEKPMARTWVEAEQVMKTASSKGGLYQLNDDNLFLPKYQVLRNVVQSGLIGEVESVRLARGSFQVKPGRSEWFYNPVESGGGCIFDYGSHAVCASWFIIGFDKVPERVKAIQIGLNDRTKYLNDQLVDIEVDDNAQFKVRYLDPPSGNWIDVFIESTWTWPRTGATSCADRGFLEVRGNLGVASSFVDENDEDFVLVKNHVFGEHRIKVHRVEGEFESFVDEIRHFLRCVRDGKRSISEENMAQNTIKILNTAQLSEQMGRVALGLDEIERFSAPFVAQSETVWKAGDRIALELNRQYRKGG